MNRRQFLLGLGCGLLPPVGRSFSEATDRGAITTAADSIRLFLGGDLMTGRGIDQILPHPSDPRLYEPYVESASVYVELAKRLNGPIPKPVDFHYLWGDLLVELERKAPNATIVNLETAVTGSGRPWPGKGIHYRMAPQNAPTLSAAGIDCVALANNHVLDWGVEGLLETLETLRETGLAVSGAGVDRRGAEQPAILELDGGGRILVFSFGATSSGIPKAWGATATDAGIWLLDDLTDTTVMQIVAAVDHHRRPRDIAVGSIHWGGNWGYGIPEQHSGFARDLIDRAGIDVVHGHSSHHPLGIEVYRNRPILYGCGDLLNDYEGISGHERYRSELSLGYWLELDRSTGELASLRMTPFRMRRFRLERAAVDEARWLAATMDRECRPLGSSVALADTGELVVSWEEER